MCQTMIARATDFFNYHLATNRTSRKQYNEEIAPGNLLLNFLSPFGAERDFGVDKNFMTCLSQTLIEPRGQLLIVRPAVCRR